jgi:cytochrome P450
MTVPVAPGRWPLLGHTLAMLRHRHGFTSALHRHGDIVEIYLGPMRTYFVTSPELTHQVLVTEGGNFAKGAMFDKFRPYLGNGILLSNGAFHLRQRRLILPAFHHNRIARYADTMASVVTELTESWQPGEIRQIDHDMLALAVTVVGETLFSTELGKQAIAEARRSIPVIIKQGMIRALSPAVVEKMPIPGNRRFDEAIGRMRDIVLKVIAAWRADGVDHGDLLSMLMLAHDDGGDGQQGMTDQQVYDEVLSLLTAGVETTALALGWLFHELGRQPEVQRRLQAEVDEVLGGRQVTFDDVSKLTYTRQVINEVLRTYPIWILMRRATAEVNLGGIRIPPGTEVIISPHALHFDQRWYAEPHRFNPDRWHPDHAKEIPPGAFIPFGGGIRQCIGNMFAQTELVIAVATIAATWRLEPVPGKPVRVKFTSAAYPSHLSMTAVPRN